MSVLLDQSPALLSEIRLRRQSGIAIGPILFVIAILAILAAAIAAGSGSFTASTTAESTKTQASAIIQYADLVTTAVQQVMIGNQCTDTQITFSNPVITAANGGGDPYANSNAPSNKSCNIFDINGGGIVWSNPPTGSTLNADTYFFTGANCVPGVGNGSNSNCWMDSSTFEIMMILPNISYDLCTQINAILGKGSVVYTAYGVYYDYFTGSYPAVGGEILSNNIGVSEPPNWYTGQMQMCMKGSLSHNAGPTMGTYQYYRVLWPR